MHCHSVTLLFRYSAPTSNFTDNSFRNGMFVWKSYFFSSSHLIYINISDTQVDFKTSITFTFMNFFYTKTQKAVQNTLCLHIYSALTFIPFEQVFSVGGAITYIPVKQETISWWPKSRIFHTRNSWVQLENYLICR